MGKSVEDFLKNLAVGGVAAAISKTLVAPMERVKIVLQVQAASTQIAKEQQYKGIGDAFKRIYMEEGMGAFWRGNGTNVIRYFPTQALNFAFKDRYKQALFPKKASEYSYGEMFARNMAAGGLAGGTSLLFVYPLDFARTRLTADMGKGDAKQYKGLMDCLVKSAKADGGVMGLYKGFGPSLAGIIPYRAVFFGGYDTLKAILLKDEKSASFWKKWGISQTNTTVAQMVVYPLDTVRRRLAMRGGGKDALYTNSFDCAKKIFQAEGITGFYKGAWANTLRATGGALCIVFYDEIKKALNL